MVLNIVYDTNLLYQNNPLQNNKTLYTNYTSKSILITPENIKSNSFHVNNILSGTYDKLLLQLIIIGM